VVLLLLVPSICAPQTDSEYARGVAAFRAGDYASAADLFAKAEMAAPGTTDALIYQAKSHIHLQNFSSSESALRRYIALHKDSDEALYLLGFVLHRENKASESLEIYTKAAALKTPTGEDFKIVGLDYVLLNDYANAIKWLAKAVELEPKNKDAWYYLGRAYYSRSLLRESRRAFLTVLDLDPRDAKAENSLGLILESEAKPDEAMEAYRKAMEWQAGSAHRSEQPYLNLGNLLLELDRAGEAIVSTMVSLAHTLGLSVTAEGVETAPQAEQLAALGCDVGQGWHLGMPGAADRIGAPAAEPADHIR